MTEKLPSIGDHVSFSLYDTEFAYKTNFGQVRAAQHGKFGLDYTVVLPDGRSVVRHHKLVQHTPALPEHTIGDQVNVASFEDDGDPIVRLPKRFWIDVNPVTVMAIRLTPTGYVYLFEDIPLEYTRWVSEVHLASAAIGSPADILSVLRDEMDPETFARLKEKLNARKTADALQLT